jgi:hypothetical protein
MIDYAYQDISDLRKHLNHVHLRQVVVRVTIKVLTITIVILTLMRSY